MEYLKEKTEAETKTKMEEIELKKEQLKLERERFELEKAERAQKIESEKQEKTMLLEMFRQCLQK